MSQPVDLGFRIAHLADSSLRMVRLAASAGVFCANPAYLARAGTPASPRDLAAHRIITVTGRPGCSLPGRRDCAGALYQSARLEAEGQLCRVLDADELPLILVNLVYPAGRHLPTGIRLFIDFATARLRGQFAAPA